VVEVPLYAELFGPEAEPDERIDPGAPAAWIEGEAERGDEAAAVVLRTGAPGDATLTLIDRETGLALSELDVEVRAPAAVVAVPRGAAYWDALRGMRPRILDGSIVNFDVFATDELGRPLAGVGIEHGRGTLVASARPADGGAAPLGVGLHQLAVDGLPPVEIEVVDRASIVGIELLEEPDAGALIAVAVDGEGEPVLGAAAGWSQGQDGAQGDLYAYRPDPHAEAVAVTATLDGHRATAWVRQAAPGEVGRSDVSGCASTAAPAGWALGLVGAVLARRRRSRSETQ
jgi:MYXO-CTERM domain-containing protein